MPDATARSADATAPSCAFIQFAEMFMFPAHTVGHLNMCDALTTLGVETTLYMLPPAEGPLPDPAKLAADYGLRNAPRISWVERDGNPWLARLRALRESARLGKRVTFTYSTRALPTLGALLGGASPAVLEIHQPSVFWSRNDRLALRMARRNKNLRIVCISQNLARVVAAEWGIDESSIIVEHSGHHFPIRDDYRASDASGRRLRALYVGSFDPGKGIDTIFELARLHADVDFVVVGGTLPDLDLPRNVVLQPRVPHAEVPDLLAGADLLLMPFTRYSGEGMPPHLRERAEEFYSPLKMVEYLSAGRAIISSNLPSIAEVLVDGENCLLVEPDLLQSWSDAVELLKNDPELRERLAHGAAQTAHRHTTVERARRILEGIGVTV